MVLKMVLILVPRLRGDLGIDFFGKCFVLFKNYVAVNTRMDYWVMDR